MMRLVGARRLVTIRNEAVRISPPQEQTELPDDEEVIGDSHRPAVKGGEPTLDGCFKVKGPAPCEGLCHETIETPQHPFGTVVLNAERALELQEVLEFLGEAASEQVCHLGTGNAQRRSCPMSMPAYLEIDRVSEWPTTSTITLGRTPRFSCSAIWAQRKTFIPYLAGSPTPAFCAYRCRLDAIEFVAGTL